MRIYYRKIKDASKVWCINNFGNANKKLNRDCITSCLTKGWRGVNRIRWDTDTEEVVQIGKRGVWGQPHKKEEEEGCERERRRWRRI